MVTREAQAIEAFFRRRYGREALYLAFREWLRPGNRLLMSPLNDDVLFFVVLAAGLVPVSGPVDPRTGNLDPAAIGDAAWATLRSMLTTNLMESPTAWTCWRSAAAATAWCCWRTRRTRSTAAGTGSGSGSSTSPLATPNPAARTPRAGAGC